MRRGPLLAVSTVAVAGLTFAVYRLRPTSTPSGPRPTVQRIDPALREGNANFATHPAKAEQAYREFVERRKSSADPKVQDQVGDARIHLGYLQAKKSEFGKARLEFLSAATEYKGTGGMGADFGGIPDQAAYQAAVCLVADHKEEEAKKEFLRFLRERPESPLVHAAYRRLIRLNGGDSKPEYDDLLQAAVTKQEKNIRFEMSVCGPKVIEYLLGLDDVTRLRRSPDTATPQSRKSPSYVVIAKLCGTTDSGTTIEGMRKGLKALDIESFAYRLNRKDLAKAPLPGILLEQDHYVALLKVEGDTAIVYDTRLKAERPIKLPPPDNLEFCVTAILFSQPEIEKP